MYLEIYRFTTEEESGEWFAWLVREAICDTFSSLIWDIEYFECGAFEIYIAATPENVKIFQQGRIIGRSNDNQNYGIIEKVRIETDAENGDYLTVSGRFLMSLLERRIIYPTLTFSKNTSCGEIVQTAVNKNCIKSGVGIDAVKRVIPSLQIGSVAGECWEQKATLQVSYENLMEFIYKICKIIGGTANIRLVPFTEGFIDGRYRLSFELSQGTDRSISQNENPAVIFSDTYDNLLSYEYDSDSSTKTNFAYAFGQGVGQSRSRTTYFSGEKEPEFLDRYELYVDADDISDTTTNDDGQTIKLTDSEYKELLKSRSKEKLTSESISSEAEILPEGKQFVYGQDYYVGDYITLQYNRFGLQTDRIQLIGMIESFDENGSGLTPVMQQKEM